MRTYSLMVLVAAWSTAAPVGSAQTSPSNSAIADYYLRTGHPQAAEFYIQAGKKADEPKAPWNPPTKDPAKAASLDQLIAEALKNNPDIRVAEAKAREVAAELDRVRLKVASDVAILHADIEAVKAALVKGHDQYERAKKLHEAKVISKEEYDAAKLAVEKMKAELASIQAKLPYLLGRQTGTANSYDNTAIPSLRPPGLKPGSAKVAPEVEYPSPMPDSPRIESLRKSLAMPMTLDSGGIEAKTAVELVCKKLGVNVLIRQKGLEKNKLDIALKEPIPVGAVVQYLEDELDVVFILRDYGIVVIGKMEGRPPDSLRLLDLRKSVVPQPAK
jgi:hypothetical protein